MTTRNGGVASVMGTLPTYCLMPLSEDDCWLLFIKHVFKNGGVSGHPILEVIGRQICQLRLLECPKLIRILPLDYFPKLETLEMRSANVEFLTISQESKLLSISKLDIYFCPNFVYFSNGGLHAPHLTNISIWGCKKLRSLPEQMHTLLPSLRNLWIVDCPELESFPEGGLPSELSSLYIRSCKKLTANRMQWGLGRLTSLVDLALSFEECEEVGAFPEEGLLPPSLTTLSIIDMSNLKIMDGKGLRQLICHERLTIWRCPELQCLPVLHNETLLQSFAQPHTVKVTHCNKLQAAARGVTTSPPRKFVTKRHNPTRLK